MDVQVGGGCIVVLMTPCMQVKGGVFIVVGHDYESST